MRVSPMTLCQLFKEYHRDTTHFIRSPLWQIQLLQNGIALEEVALKCYKFQLVFTGTQSETIHTTRISVNPYLIKNRSIQLIERLLNCTSKKTHLQNPLTILQLELG